jgi:hypothetical protein
MATKEIKQLVLKRVPPGDQWTDTNKESEVFPSLTDGLEYSFQQSGGKNTEFHLSAFKGEIYSVHTEEQPDTPPPPKPRYSMYGEEVDEQPSLFGKE